MRFFDSLRAHGLDVIEHPFPDHHAYAPGDLAFADRLPVLMTDKDAIKCRSFAQPDWWRVPVQAELAPEFFDALGARLTA
jgi:tetraacyldisaccharide 4'-kinase